MSENQLRMNLDLAMQFAEAYTYCNACETYDRTLKNKIVENEKIKRTFRNLGKRKSRLWVPAVILGAIFGFFSLIFLIAGTEDPDFTILGVFFLGIALICVVLFVCLSILQKNSVKGEAVRFWATNRNIVQYNEAAVSRLGEERDLFIKYYAYALDIVAPKYRSAYAVSYMYNTVLSGEAMSLQDAVRLFETHWDRRRGRISPGDLMELQRNIERQQQALNQPPAEQNSVLSALRSLQIASYYF